MKAKTTHSQGAAPESPPDQADRQRQLEELVFEFAEALLAHQFEGVQALLATGLGAHLSAKQIQHQLEAICKGALASKGLLGLYYPIDFDLKVFVDKTYPDQLEGSWPGLNSPFWRIPEPWPESGVGWARVEFFASSRLGLGEFLEMFLLLQEGSGYRVGGIELRIKEAQS